MINIIQFVIYSFRIVIHPITTATRIVRERNAKASYYATWLALVAVIVNMVLYSQNAMTQVVKHRAPQSIAVTVNLIGIFIMVPITFFLGRFLFVTMTKGGLRLLSHRRYPKQEQERKIASDTLQMVYPYLYVPIAFQMLLQLVFYPVSSALFAILQALAAVYVLILQVVFIKRIYQVSGVVAFFSPVIIWWMILFIFWIIWLITTGSVFVLSNYT